MRARYPDARFVTDLWQEGSRLMQKGYLKIPPEVALVWADTGYGDMQDHQQVAAVQGAYFHVAMMNGQANQLSEKGRVRQVEKLVSRRLAHRSLPHKRAGRKLRQSFTRPKGKNPTAAVLERMGAYFHIMEYEGDRTVDVH